MKYTTNTFSSENIKYVEEQIGKEKIDIYFWLSKMTDGNETNVSEEDEKIYNLIQNCLVTMKEYGDNRWWASDDERIVAYYQLNCKEALLVSVDKFKKALNLLLGRKVFTHEIIFNWESLVEEAERAFNGMEDTEEQKAKSFSTGLQKLADTGMEVICVRI